MVDAEVQGLFDEMKDAFAELWQGEARLTGLRTDVDGDVFRMRFEIEVLLDAPVAEAVLVGMAKFCQENVRDEVQDDDRGNEGT